MPDNEPPVSTPDPSAEELEGTIFADTGDFANDTGAAVVPLADPVGGEN